MTSLAPKYINIRRGQIIAVTVGVFGFAPWKVLQSAGNFVRPPGLSDPLETHVSAAHIHVLLFDCSGPHRRTTCSRLLCGEAQTTQHIRAVPPRRHLPFLEGLELEGVCGFGVWSRTQSPWNDCIVSARCPLPLLPTDRASLASTLVSILVTSSTSS